MEQPKKYDIPGTLSDNKELTENDMKTLLILMKQGRITNPALLEELNLMSANLGDPNSAAHHRKKLEKIGVVEGYTARINWAKLGYPTEFVVIATSNKKEALLEIERGHVAGIKSYREKTGADIFVIPINDEGDKIILKDVLFGGEKPIAIISGMATDEGAVMIYANFYLPKKFPGIETNVLIIHRSTIRDFEFKDKFIESMIPVLFDDNVDIKKYMDAYEKEFKWKFLNG